MDHVKRAREIVQENVATFVPATAANEIQKELQAAHEEFPKSSRDFLSSMGGISLAALLLLVIYIYR